MHPTCDITKALMPIIPIFNRLFDACFAFIHKIPPKQSLMRQWLTTQQHHMRTSFGSDLYALSVLACLKAHQLILYKSLTLVDHFTVDDQNAIFHACLKRQIGSAIFIKDHIQAHKLRVL